MATATELRELDTEELERQLGETRRELFNLRFQLATGQLDNTSRLNHVRKDIARMLTDAARAGDRRGRGPGHGRAARPPGRRPPPTEDEALGRTGRTASSAGPRPERPRRAEADERRGRRADVDEDELAEDVADDDGWPSPSRRRPRRPTRPTRPAEPTADAEETS